jgi:hypothetical protein
MNRFKCPACGRSYKNPCDGVKEIKKILKGKECFTWHTHAQYVG